MPVRNQGTININGKNYIIQPDTYQKQLQTPNNARFSTGDPGFSDLSFFQFLAMEDWSGGNGQEIFRISNRFFDSENVDVSRPEEIRLAPKIEHVIDINGPDQEHINRPVEQEDSWPQIIEWLGQGVIYNDRIEYDSGGLEFLEVFETDIVEDTVIGDDPNGEKGTITDDTRAEILEISSVDGLPGDTIQMKVKFKKVVMNHAVAVGDLGIIHQWAAWYGQSITPSTFPHQDLQKLGDVDGKATIRFRISFGGESARDSEYFAEREIEVAHSQITLGEQNSWDSTITLNEDVTLDFTLKIPEFSPGIYKIFTGAYWTKNRYKFRTGVPVGNAGVTQAILDKHNQGDSAANAQVLFFIKSVDQVLVVRKNLYAPQLKAATVIGSKLIGARSFEGAGFIEVYEEQNEAVDRTLQISFVDAAIADTNPTYVELIGRQGLVFAALDNKLFKVDIETSGLTDAQRMTLIGTVAGDYVSGMSLWNQRLYIGSFDKSSFESQIAWTDKDGGIIEDSYAIDGKFWITDMVNFQGALVYSGGNQDGEGKLVAFPAEELATVEHPAFDSRIRSLNVGRQLYFGRSHATGLGIATTRGISNWASVNLGDDSTNVIWDIEEVGQTVFFLTNNQVMKTVPGKFVPFGFLETSRLGGNTPLIEKIWTSLSLEVEDMGEGDGILVYVSSETISQGQWQPLGVMIKADGFQKTFLFHKRYISDDIKVRLEIFSINENNTPVIKKLLVKYVPSALKKLQWAMGIRATNNLKLHGGKSESRSGAEIVNDLFDLRNEGAVTFTDKDGIIYNVIITDIREQTPVLDERNLESIIFLEILEA